MTCPAARRCSASQRCCRAGLPARLLVSGSGHGQFCTIAQQRQEAGAASHKLFHPQSRHTRDPCPAGWCLCTARGVLRGLLTAGSFCSSAVLMPSTETATGTGPARPGTSQPGSSSSCCKHHCTAKGNEGSNTLMKLALM